LRFVMAAICYHKAASKIILILSLFQSDFLDNISLKTSQLSNLI
jgi:hypothetical protein